DPGHKPDRLQKPLPGNSNNTHREKWCPVRDQALEHKGKQQKKSKSSQPLQYIAPRYSGKPVKEQKIGQAGNVHSWILHKKQSYDIEQSACQLCPTVQQVNDRGPVIIFAYCDISEHLFHLSCLSLSSRSRPPPALVAHKPDDRDASLPYFPQSLHDLRHLQARPVQ